MNSYKSLFSIFFNHFIRLTLFFCLSTFNLLHKVEFIRSSISLLIQPISFLAQIMNCNVGKLMKFALRSFKAIKQLPVSFTSVLLSASTCLTCLIYLGLYQFLRRRAIRNFSEQGRFRGIRAL